MQNISSETLQPRKGRGGAYSYGPSQWPRPSVIFLPYCVSPDFFFSADPNLVPNRLAVRIFECETVRSDSLGKFVFSLKQSICLPSLIWSRKRERVCVVRGERVALQEHLVHGDSTTPILLGPEDVQGQRRRQSEDIVAGCTRFSGRIVQVLSVALEPFVFAESLSLGVSLVLAASLANRWGVWRVSSDWDSVSSGGYRWKLNEREIWANRWKEVKLVNKK